MLGSALLPVLRQSHQVIGLGSQDCDIRDLGAVINSLRAYRPELVIHLAAYTDVDGCETDPRKAEESNGAGTRNVALACAGIDATMLYLSTDYVFDGSKGEAYREQDWPNPINVYGHSKLLGEQHVQAILDRYFIVRTSWLFGPKGKNFVATILELAHRDRVLRVVSNQRGSPTYTRHLASKLVALIETKKYGIYHVTGTGNCSWFEFAQSIVHLSGLKDVHVMPSSSDECPRLARRPANSVLENHCLSLTHMGLLPHWKAALADYIGQLVRERDQDRFGEIRYGEATVNRGGHDDLA